MKLSMFTLAAAVAINTFVYTPTQCMADGQNTITGKIIFKGDPDAYKRTKINTSKDPNCKKSKKTIGSEQVIINKKSDPMTLRNVVVSIKEGLGKKAFPVSKEQLTITQFGCQYVPHVLAGQAGQELRILNGDDTNHNIHFLPEVNDQYNFTQPKKDTEVGKVITLKAEDPFKVKCDVHPWMNCFMAIFEHPFFDVTDKEGTYTLAGMDDGKYTIEAWHEEFGKVTAEVEVSGGKAANQDLTFEPKP